jgi:hypothetical protein
MQNLIHMVLFTTVVIGSSKPGSLSQYLKYKVDSALLVIIITGVCKIYLFVCCMINMFVQILNYG